MILIIECLFHFTFLIINFEKKKTERGKFGSDPLLVILVFSTCIESYHQILGQRQTITLVFILIIVF